MKRKMLSSSFKSNPRLLELHTTLEKFIHNHHYHPPVISVKEATQSAYYGKHQSYWLPMAVQMGQIDCVRNLLEKGADPNSIDYGGETSLCIAIKIGYAPVVKILLERGANPNVENLKGESPLALAVQAKRNDLVELLLKRGASPFIPYSPVLQSILGKGRHMVGMAIEENDIEILQVVLENISSIPQEILDKALANVLLKNTEEGANKNHIEMAELLLSKGAKIDEYNVTMMKSNLLLVSLPFLLKENGHAAHIDQNKLGSLDVLLKDEDFKKFLGTPLGSALCRGNVRAVQWLIAHGVEHQKNIAGKTMEELADILGKGEVRDFFRQLNVMPPSPLQRGP